MAIEAFSEGRADIGSSDGGENSKVIHISQKHLASVMKRSTAIPRKELYDMSFSEFMETPSEKIQSALMKLLEEMYSEVGFDTATLTKIGGQKLVDAYNACHSIIVSDVNSISAKNITAYDKMQKILSLISLIPSRIAGDPDKKAEFLLKAKEEFDSFPNDAYEYIQRVFRS